MVNNKLAVLVVDDEKAICDLIYEELDGEGYVCDVAADADDALGKLESNSFDVALLDIMLPGMSGMDLLKEIEKFYQTTIVVMMTAVKDLDTAIEAMKLGASDYIVKPFTLEKLKSSITTVLENRKRHCAACATMPCYACTDYNNIAENSFLGEINAIAYGVDAQINCFDFHSKTVTQKTVGIARWLDLPEKAINKWEIARNELELERDKKLNTALSNLERNPVAQMILGLTQSTYHFPRSGEGQN